MSDIARLVIGGPENGKLLTTRGDFAPEYLVSDGSARIRYEKRDFRVTPGHPLIPAGTCPLFTHGPLPPDHEILDLLVKSRG